MDKVKRNWIGAGALAVGLVAVPLTAAAGTTGRDGDPAVVRTAQGAVRGTVAADHRSFQGIPYAEPLTKKLRWQSPQPMKPWKGVHDATKPGPGCAQPEGLPMDRPSEAEDCLYLNVTTPSGRPDKRLRPVLVWLHGGHFFLGQGDTWGGRKMAVEGDVVVVTVNYRLGPLGFLTHPGLRRAPGNFGIEDQQAALRWVRANVAAFGGDPNNVTLAGQSAGATSVCAQLAAPGSKGLFHRAVLQSNSCTTPLRTREEAEAAAEALIKRTKCDKDAVGVAACMRELPARKLIQAAGYPGESAWEAAPVAGGPVLPVDPAKALATGRFHRVPILIGATRDEYRAQVWGMERTHMLCAPDQKHPCALTDDQYREQIRAAFGARAGRVLARYPLNDYPTPSEALSAAMTDFQYALPILDTARAFSRYVPTFMYEFADRDAPFFTEAAPVTFATGAYHMAELPYLFAVGSFRLPAAAQDDLSDTMVSYWTRFAHKGDPNGRGLPSWPRFDAQTGHVQRLATGPDAIRRTDFEREHRIDFWRSLMG